MRFTVLLFLISITAWAVGCSSSSTPPPTAAPPPSAPNAAPAVTATPVAQAAAPTAATPSPVAQATAPSPSAILAPKPEFTVEAYDDFFRPEKITITVGTKVTWVNLGKKDHTVTYGTLFDGDLKVGDTFSFTFDKPGTYQYYCVTHSESDTEGMVGTITVSPP
ncbi:MAG: plastocyanin/azurin family copper-binding protein [Acidobacteriota bacterium]